MFFNLKSSVNFALNNIRENVKKQREFLKYTVKERKYCLSRCVNGFRHEYMYAGMYVCMYRVFPFLLGLSYFFRVNVFRSGLLCQ